MRSFLRAILAFALLLGAGTGDWAPAAEPHACCCGDAAPAEDACPCPKPGPARGCQDTRAPRPATVAAPAPWRAEQGQRAQESHPAPPAVAEASAEPAVPLAGGLHRPHGRDPDLRRRLARLETFRI